MASIWQSYDSGENFIQRHRGLANIVVHAVHQDPHDHDRLLACCADEGLMVSQDHGQTWERMMEGAGSMGGHVYSVSISRQDPDKAYMGMRYWFGADVETRLRILKTSDRCETWSDVGFEVPVLPPSTPPQCDKRVKMVLVHPSDDQIVYVATSGWGVWKTVDGGNTWTEKNSGITNKLANGYQCLVMHPDDPDVLFLSCNLDGVYRSMNGGDTWENVSSAILGTLGFEAGTHHTTSLAIDPIGKDKLAVGAPKKWVLMADDILSPTLSDSTHWHPVQLPRGPWTQSVPEPDYADWISDIATQGIAYHPTFRI